MRNPADYSYFSVDFEITPIVTAVPEPASLAILGADAPGLGLIRQRRAARTA